LMPVLAAAASLLAQQHLGALLSNFRSFPR